MGFRPISPPQTPPKDSLGFPLSFPPGFPVGVNRISGTAFGQLGRRRNAYCNNRCPYGLGSSFPFGIEAATRNPLGFPHIPRISPDPWDKRDIPVISVHFPYKISHFLWKIYCMRRENHGIKNKNLLHYNTICHKLLEKKVTKKKEKTGEFANFLLILTKDFFVVDFIKKLCYSY